MKRTRLFRQVKNASSAVPVEPAGSEETDSSKEQQPDVAAKNNTKLSFANLIRNRTNTRKDNVAKVTKDKKLRATVDLELMKEELKQLEDPPHTDEEKKICSQRLQYSFFDIPCTDLAQKLLGKILVRRLENGTILKGRIVETEAYIGEIDKASQTYQGRVTPRNLPMYMQPGTIYVYFTYGMYHCFNISSSESGSFVLVRALEVLDETDYIELLRNSESKIGKTVKLMTENIRSIEPYELCNDPSKICTAFAIDVDDLSEKNLWSSSCIWLENDSSEESFFIVAAPRLSDESIAKISRYYILGNPCVSHRNLKFEELAYVLYSWNLGKGCAILLRGVEPTEGTDLMRSHRSSRPKSKEPKKLSKPLSNHELCNGPSKLCISFQIDKNHCKYSVCTCKWLWIEDDEKTEDIKVVKCSRIGIDSAGPEWANKPLRYYVYGNTSVSKRDKRAEAELLSGE